MPIVGKCIAYTATVHSVLWLHEQRDTRETDGCTTQHVLTHVRYFSLNASGKVALVERRHFKNMCHHYQAKI